MVVIWVKADNALNYHDLHDYFGVFLYDVSDMLMVSF